MKILFIGHDAHRAGAQILLLQFLNWIKINRKDIYFEVILAEGGNLLDDYLKTGSVKVFYLKSGNRIFKNKLTVFLKKLILLSGLKKKKFDLIYSNTIVNGEVLNILKSLHIPVITHVHELNYWISRAGELNLNFVNSLTWNYIVASESVKNCLINSYNIDSNKITKISEFIIFNELGKDKKSLKKELNLPADSIIVGASGAEIWRKGKDWFILLAIDILSRQIDKDIYFVWIGGELNYELKHDLNNSGFQSKIHFIPHLANANNYFHEFSVFAMLSREDPFPVVNLEAAAHGVPIVCFDKSGGTPDLIEEGCGFVVPYGNINEFANKVWQLINDKELSLKISNNSINQIRNNYDINIVAKKIIEKIEVFKKND